MKNKFIVILIFLNFFLYSQNVVVEYNVSENTTDPVLATLLNYTLIINKNESSYFTSTDSIDQFKYKKLISEVSKIGELTRVKLSDNHYAYVKKDYFYKNYIKDTLLYNELILNKKVIVGEKINLFDWEIKASSDTIVLGFKCQKAQTKFRGRTYEALFSNEIAPYGGPWKFDGLPGLILSVKSLDNYFLIEPKKIIKSNETNYGIDNIYENEKIISWTNFKETLKNKLLEQLKRLKVLSETGEGGSIKITDKIEDLEIPELKF